MFKKFTSIENTHSKYSHAYYRWQNKDYAELIQNIMRALEPRYVKKNTYILKEMEECDEVLMFTEGCFKIGFELNGKEIYKLRYKNTVKPDYSVAEEVQSQFVDVLGNKLNQHMRGNRIKLNANHGEPIGQYYCTFHRKSDYYYKTITDCSGFFVRKSKWHVIFSDDTPVVEQMKK